MGRNLNGNLVPCLPAPRTKYKGRASKKRWPVVFYFYFISCDGGKGEVGGRRTGINCLRAWQASEAEVLPHSYYIPTLSPLNCCYSCFLVLCSAGHEHVAIVLGTSFLAAIVCFSFFLRFLLVAGCSVVLAPKSIHKRIAGHSPQHKVCLTFS